MKTEVRGCLTAEYGQRMAHNAATQKEWANEQSRQMAEQRAREAEEERQYAAQTDALNRMRGMLEDENNMKRANMLK